MTFRGNFKVTNVKIAYIFLMVQNRHMVAMKLLWDPQTNSTLDDLGGFYFKVTKVKIMWVLISERWIHACHRLPNLIINNLDSQED